MENKRVEFYTLLPEKLSKILAACKEEMIEEVMTNLTVGISSNLHARKLENAVFFLDFVTSIYNLSKKQYSYPVELSIKTIINKVKDLNSVMLNLLGMMVKIIFPLHKRLKFRCDWESIFNFLEVLYACKFEYVHITPIFKPFLLQSKFQKILWKLSDTFDYRIGNAIYEKILPYISTNYVNSIAYLAIACSLMPVNKFVPLEEIESWFPKMFELWISDPTSEAVSNIFMELSKRISINHHSFNWAKYLPFILSQGTKILKIAGGPSFPSTQIAIPKESKFIIPSKSTNAFAFFLINILNSSTLNYYKTIINSIVTEMNLKNKMPTNFQNFFVSIGKALVQRVKFQNCFPEYERPFHIEKDLINQVIVFTCNSLEYLFANSQVEDILFKTVEYFSYFEIEFINKFLIENILLKHFDNPKANSNSIITVLPSFILPVILNETYKEKYKLIQTLIQIALTKIPSIFVNYSNDLFSFLIQIVQQFPLLLESEVKELFAMQNPNLAMEEFLTTNDEKLIEKSQFLNLLLNMETYTSEIFGKLMKIISNFQVKNSFSKLSYNLAVITLRPIISNSSEKFVSCLLSKYLINLDEDLIEDNKKIFANLNKWFCLRIQASTKIISLILRKVLIQEEDNMKNSSIVEMILAENKKELSHVRLAGMSDEKLALQIYVLVSAISSGDISSIFEHCDALETLILKLMNYEEKTKYKLAGKILESIIKGLLKVKVKEIPPLPFLEYSNPESVLNFYTIFCKLERKNIKPEWSFPNQKSIQKASEFIKKYVLNISEKIINLKEFSDYKLINKWLIFFGAAKSFCIYSTSKKTGSFVQFHKAFLKIICEGDEQILDELVNRRESLINILLSIIRQMKKIDLNDESSKSLSTNLIKAIYEILKGIAIEDMKTQRDLKNPLIKDLNRNYTVYRDKVSFAISSFLQSIGNHRSLNTIDLFVELINLINGVENKDSIKYIGNLMNQKYHVCHSHGQFNKIMNKIEELLLSFIENVSKKENKEIIEFENSKINMVIYLSKLCEFGNEISLEINSDLINIYEKANQLFSMDQKKLEQGVMIFFKSIQESFAKNFFDQTDYKSPSLILNDNEYLSKILKDHSKSVEKHSAQMDEWKTKVKGKMNIFYNHLLNVKGIGFNSKQELILIANIFSIASRSDVSMVERLKGINSLIKFVNSENILTHLTAESMITKLLKVQIHLISDSKFIKIPENLLIGIPENICIQVYPQLVMDELNKEIYGSAQLCKDRKFKLMPPNIYKMYKSKKLEEYSEIDFSEFKNNVSNPKFINEYLQMVSDCITLAFEQSLGDEESKFQSTISAMLERLMRIKSQGVTSLEGFSQIIQISLNIKDSKSKYVCRYFQMFSYYCLNLFGQEFFSLYKPVLEEFIKEEKVYGNLFAVLEYCAAFLRSGKKYGFSKIEFYNDCMIIVKQILPLIPIDLFPDALQALRFGYKNVDPRTSQNWIVEIYKHLKSKVSDSISLLRFLLFSRKICEDKEKMMHPDIIKSLIEVPLEYKHCEGVKEICYLCNLTSILAYKILTSIKVVKDEAPFIITTDSYSINGDNFNTEEWILNIFETYKKIDDEGMKDPNRNSLVSILLNEIVTFESNSAVKFNKALSEVIKYCYNIQVNTTEKIMKIALHSITKAVGIVRNSSKNITLILKTISDMVLSENWKIRNLSIADIAIIGSINKFLIPLDNIISIIKSTIVNDKIIEVKKNGCAGLYLLYRILNEEFLINESTDALKEIDKRKSQYKDQKSNNSLITELEGYILILSAIINAVNYRFPSWIIPLLKEISSLKYYEDNIGRIADEILADFLKQRKLTWEMDKEKLTSEEAMEIMEYQNPYNYFI